MDLKDVLITIVRSSIGSPTNDPLPIPSQGHIVALDKAVAVLFCGHHLESRTSGESLHLMKSIESPLRLEVKLVLSLAADHPLEGMPTVFDFRGGIKGSFPVNGAYGRYQYLNWAAKFFMDSLMLEDKYNI